jgi:mycofactocin precursor
MAEANVQTTEPTDEVAADEPVADEVLVEEISIDGMCGVY